MSSFSAYNIAIRKNTHHQSVDIISLDDFEDKDYSPYEIITFNNKFVVDADTGVLNDLPLSCYFVNTIHSYIEHKMSENPLALIRDPKTNTTLHKSQLRRVKFYRDFHTTFLSEMTEEHRDVFMNGDEKKRNAFGLQVIQMWEQDREKTYLNTLMKYCVNFDCLTQYYGFQEIDSRDKAYEYLASPERKRDFVIRKSSIQDTKYYKFFVIQTKPGIISLMVHIQGFGILPATSTTRFCNANACVIDYDTEFYYVSMGECIVCNAHLFYGNTENPENPETNT